MIVKLSLNEMRLACTHAAERYVSAIARGASPKVNVNQPADRASVDFLSCMAELSVAKGLNLYWSGSTDIGSNDVGPYEVRATKYQNGHLVISEKDPDDQLVVLVICNPPEFNLVGYMKAKDAKHPKYHITNDRGWCWMVPQGKLERFDEDKIEQTSSVDKDSWLFDL